MPAARLDRITVRRLEVPLVAPYRLAFGAVERFDTIVAECVSCDGRIGLCEATVLTGYTDETIDGSWRAACELAGELVRLEPVAARHRLRAVAHERPFTATAFGTALEMLEGSPHLEIDRETPVPILGLLGAIGEQTMQAEFSHLLAAGYRTVKIKVGIDVANDIAHVKAAQNVVRGRAAIRIDANQGYSAEEGVAFARALDPAGIELFEQPCAAGDWEAHLAVARASSVPMMLDESIYGLDDIERAAELGAASFVKLKLMKLGTLDDLVRALERIRSLGMKPVLGNGVACDLGCWMEACVAARHIDNAGEMNGFLKARTQLLTEPLQLRDGALRLTPGFVPRLAVERLESVIVGTHTAAPLATAAAG
ncbi:MAG: mandelate racemase [Betaproteobacteria bacterium]|nr:mandelate racemase [Betaproteobacteria bacterium]